VSFAFDMQGNPPFAPFVELGSAITSVTFVVSATFGPGAALNQGRYDKLLRREREAVGAFDPAAVYALAAAAQSDYPGNVIDRAIRENFAGLSLEQMNTVAGIFELEKAIIQSVPYWGTREASEVHFELKWLLERLPKRVVTNQVLTPELTGAAATVF